jgi:hypothetical protein
VPVDQLVEAVQRLEAIAGGAHAGGEVEHIERLLDEVVRAGGDRPRRAAPSATP